MVWYTRCIFLLVLLVPISTRAVEISEISWMGSIDSPNHEWIELYVSETKDLTGWTITDGFNLLIELDGVASSDTYAVLERTSDASASGAAWQLYTGSLVNTGAALVLRDENGLVVDRVTGGEDWKLIGGDNITKETAQLSESGWITAVATPGRVNSLTTTSVSVDEDEADGSYSATGVSHGAHTAQSSIVLTLPDITLQLAVIAPTLVYVNQPVFFTVAPSGIGQTLIDSLQYTWNFGDGAVGVDISATHSYQYPGNYVVVVAGEYKRQKQFTRHELVVLPVSLAIVQLADGAVGVQNNSKTEIDLANYRLVGNKEFVFSEHTILLPQSQITLAKDEFLIGSIPQMIALYDQAGAQVASYVPGMQASAVATNPDLPLMSKSSPFVSEVRAALDDSRYTFASADSDTTERKTQPLLSATSTQTTEDPVFEKEEHSFAWPQYTLFGVLLIGILAIYLVPKQEKDDSPWA